MPPNDLRILTTTRARPRTGGFRLPSAGRAAAVALCLASLPAALSAQAVLGGGDDATVLRRGRARIRIGGILETATERFGGRGGALRQREPIGADASFDSLGVGFLPTFLQPVQDTLRALTGTSGYVASLGQLRSDVRVDVQTIPFLIEYGVLDRLTVSALLPYVRTRSSLNPVFNPTGTEGTLGFNPATALGGSGASTALQRNGLVAQQLTAATTALRALVTTCAAPNPTDPRCTGFSASAANALAAEAAAVQSRIAYVYGTGTSGSGRAFVPIAGTAPQRAVEARLADLSRRFGTYQITSLAATTAPAGATARLGLAGLQTLLSDERFGIAGDSLRGLVRSGSGDIELAGTVQWLDTFHGSEQARLAPRGLQLRSSVTAGYRVGAGSGDFPKYWFDIPTGTGVDAFLFRSATDVVFGRRFWASAIVRVIQPRADQPIVRIPATPDELFVPAAREAQIERTIGRELQLEVNPRVALSDFLSIWGHWQMRSKAADEHRGTFELPAAGGQPAVTIDASVLDVESEAREQRAGLGLSYSTLAAYTRGKASLPLEVSWLYRRTLSGEGGQVLRASATQLMVRAYLRVLGDRTRNVTGVR
ncbi:hypothetical protein rosag_39250 [Roseisolibacter agri]|uniref:Uncharacterized protein n=1 Tax=Roseisolibacter agri TaxID=2014610 RepID=A0AA37Q9W2_9BACT|nr:hypothetical protein rosag_39250 [Roseisolibacter agri]